LFGPNLMRGTVAEHYAGIDVSLKESSVHVVDAKGKVVREMGVAGEPEVLVQYFDEMDLPVSRIGLRPGRYRSGCMRGWYLQDMTSCCRRRVM